jgi:hypothetical protein
MGGNFLYIPQVIRSLPRPAVEELSNWIEDYLDNQRELPGNLPPVFNAARRRSARATSACESLIY